MKKNIMRTLAAAATLTAMLGGSTDAMEEGVVTFYPGSRLQAFIEEKGFPPFYTGFGRLSVQNNKWTSPYKSVRKDIEMARIRFSLSWPGQEMLCHVDNELRDYTQQVGDEFMIDLEGDRCTIGPTGG